MRRSVLALLAAGLLIAAAPDPVRTDHERLQGAWVLVSMERNGRPIPLDQYKDGRLIMEGERFTYLKEGKIVAQGVRKLEPRRTPKAVDDTHTFGPFKGKAYRGIYTLRGDTFMTCNGSVDQDRPTEFSTQPGSGLLLIVYKRAKP